MAVFTPVSAEAIADLLARYDVGALVSAKGIAEGVENSNFLVETSQDRYILTLYEKRVDAADLPFFLALLDHLDARGRPVPPAIRDRDGRQIQEVRGRPACLIRHLPGVAPRDPLPSHARAAGEALGRLHGALADFTEERRNVLDLAGWHELAARCGDALDEIEEGLGDRVGDELAYLGARWPHHLPYSAIHADLFPDNVLMLDGRVTGIIDFYFACTDIRAYDLAVMHAAWCFDGDGERHEPAISRALIAGYEASHGLSDAEREAMPVLARGASLRFLLTRAWDWLDTPEGAMVTRKDPLEFARRLDFYREAHPSDFAA